MYSIQRNSKLLLYTPCFSKLSNQAFNGLLFFFFSTISSFMIPLNSFITSFLYFIIPFKVNLSANNVNMPGMSTVAISGDQHLNRVTDVVPPINVSASFRFPDNPKDFVTAVDYSQKEEYDPTTAPPLYSREGHPNSTRCEAILGKLNGGECVVYNSGLSAFFASILHFNPKVIALPDGYQGCRGVLELLKKNYNIKIVSLEQLDQLSKGDIIHLITPENPYNSVYNIEYYVKKAKLIGAFVLVDATLAPPPLSNPFQFDVDMIIHSATKFFGGHSDLLAGFLITRDHQIKVQLANNRISLGSNIAKMDAYLLLRSLRTYELRIKKQSSNATAIVKHIFENQDSYPALTELSHTSLYPEEFVKKQMVGGHTPVFSIQLLTAEKAKEFPSKLKYFQHATSYGGVQSTVEWSTLYEAVIPPNLLRFSVGIEDVEDLISDLDAALRIA